MRLSSLGLLLSTVAFALSGCAAASGSDAVNATGAAHEHEDAIPTYEGTGFHGAQILRLADGKWLTQADFTAELAQADVTFFGEQHLTAPVQALETWVLGNLIADVPDLGLAMEHFQHDEQPIIDRYFAGEIDQATFEATSQPWHGYAEFWRQVVETAHVNHRPLVGLNVPDEILSGLYAQFPTWPMDAFNQIADGTPRADSLPARPLTNWDVTYQGYFESAYDYAAHGQQMGLTYEEALHYFTDLAQIRDETMALWIAKSLPTTPHLMVTAGDWHVQTRLAVPDRVARLAPATKILTITTTPADKLDELRHFQHAGRSAADYIIVYSSAN